MNLDPESKSKYMKYSTVIGSLFILLPNGMIWYWGNLSIYSMSYYVSVLDDSTGVDTPYTISAFLIFWTLGLTMSESLAKRVGRRRTILIGSLASDIGILSSCFALQSSELFLGLSMGVVFGLGTGLIDSSILQLIIEWADNETGRLTALVQSSMPLGGFILNQLITEYVNPRNLSPHLERHRTKYFTQKEILKKVPSVYLIIGFFSLTCHLVGFLMLKPKPKDERRNSRINSQQIQESANEYTRRESNVLLSRSEYKDGTERISLWGTSASCSDYTPKEMIKTPSFYAFWISFFLGEMPFLILSNYYKRFGQIWIEDDHYLTAVGTVFVLGIAWTGPFFGMAMDRFGVKNCFIFYLAGLSILQVWYYFSAMLNRWIYAFETVCYGLLTGAMFSCYTAATAILYGKKHFSSNFGIVMTASLAFNLLAPFFFENILSRLGFFVLFDITAAFNVIRLFLIWIFVPSL